MLYINLYIPIFLFSFVQLPIELPFKNLKIFGLRYFYISIPLDKLFILDTIPVRFYNFISIQYYHNFLSLDLLKSFNFNNSIFPPINFSFFNNINFQNHVQFRLFKKSTS